MEKLKKVLKEDGKDLIKSIFITVILLLAVIIFITSNYADIPFVYNQF